MSGAIQGKYDSPVKDLPPSGPNPKRYACTVCVRHRKRAGQPCAQTNADTVVSGSKMSQEREGVGPHAMWGYTPAQDLLRDSPVKGEVTCLLPTKVCSVRRERGTCVCRRNALRSWYIRIMVIRSYSKTCAHNCLCRRLRVFPNFVGGCGAFQQANILICQPGDIGHVLRTIGTRRRHPQHTINVGSRFWTRNFESLGWRCMPDM